MIDEKLLMAAYEKGLNDSEIADEVGCNWRTVQEWRYKNNLQSNVVIKRKKLHAKYAQLHGLGFTDGEIAKKTHTTRANVRSWRRATSRQINSVNDKMVAPKKTHGTQLCWYCKKAAAGCSWSKNFTPINGWKAEKTTVNGIDTYAISDCPEFVHDDEGEVRDD